MRTDGDCFQAAGRYVLNHPGAEAEYVLVHGIVTGQGPLKGVQYTHAWIERDGNVLDYSNGKKTEVQAWLYYVLGRIETTVRYTPREAAKKMWETKHFGPWELEETPQEKELKEKHA